MNLVKLANAARLLRELKIGLMLFILGIASISLSCCSMASESKFFKPAGRLHFFYCRGGEGGGYGRPLEQLAAEQSNGQIALFGGTNYDVTMPIQAIGTNGPLSRKKAEVYDTHSQESRPLADSPYDLESGGIRVVKLHGDNLLIVGSLIGDARNSSDCPSYATPKERSICERTTALLYSWRDRTYRYLFNLLPVRSGNSINVLPNDEILLIGGSPGLKDTPKDVQPKVNVSAPVSRSHDLLTDNIQVFDPEKDSIKTIGGFIPPRYYYGQTANQIDKSHFLLVGGYKILYGKEHTQTSDYEKDILIYNMTNNSFVTVGTLKFPREAHVTIPLDSTRFLIVSGVNKETIDLQSKTNIVDELEVFDLRTGRSKVVGTFSAPRTTVTPVKLPDGSVLLIGGMNVGLFDPKTDSVKVIDRLIEQREGFLTMPLSNGDVYIFGGIHQHTKQLVERFDYQAFKQSEARH